VTLKNNSYYFRDFKNIYWNARAIFGPRKKLFSKTKYFAGTIFLQNGFSHHVPRVQIITKVELETKTKTRHI